MPVWTYQRNNQSTSTKNVVDDLGNLYTADGDGTMISLDSNGSLRWTATDINGDGTSWRDFSVTPDGSEVIVNFYSEAWYVLDATDGSEITSYTDTSFGMGGSSGMVTVGNSRNVYCGAFGEDYLVEYDITTQSIVQTFTPPNGAASFPQSTIHYDSKSVYIGDDSGYIYDVARSDFSQNDSLQLTATHAVTVQSGSSSGDTLVANGYDLGAGEGNYWLIDNSGAMMETGSYTENGSFTTVYDEVEGKAIHPTDSQNGIAKYSTSGGKTDEYISASGDHEDIAQSEAFDDTLIYINRNFGEITQIDDTEFESLLESISASQTSSTASMNDAFTGTRATLVSASASTESGSVTAVDTLAGQAQVQTDVSDSGTIIEDVTATQTSAAATMNTTSNLFTVPEDWSVTLPISSVSALASDSAENVYIAEGNFNTSSSTIYSYDSSGNTRWVETIDALFIQNLDVAGGNLYVTADDGGEFSSATVDLAILDKDTGNVTDTRQFSSIRYPSDFEGGAADPWFTDDADLFENYNTGVSVSNPNGESFTEVEFDGTHFWVTDTGDWVYQIDTDANIIDSVNLSGVSDITLGPSNVYVDDGGGVAKLDKGDLSVTWSVNLPDSPVDIDYDTDDNRVYVAFGSSQSPLQLRTTDGKAAETYPQRSEQNFVTVNASDTSVFTDGSDLYQVGDNEWQERLINATPTTASASTNTGDVTYAVIVRSSMNDVSVDAVSASASQANVAGLMNNPSGDLTANASQPSITASMNNLAGTERITSAQAEAIVTPFEGATRDRNATWTIEDSDGVTYTADSMRLDNGTPLFRRGRDIERTFVFTRDSAGQNHTQVYEDLKTKFNEYISTGTVKIAQTYDGKPHFTQNINPRSEATSYLWKVTPNAAIPDTEPWWVVVTNIQDVTRQIGPAEALTVNMYAIAPVSEGDRAYIEDKFEV